MLIGGSGADQFEFTTEYVPESTIATIRDFNVAEDMFAFQLFGETDAQGQQDFFMGYASLVGNDVVFDASADASAMFTITLEYVDLADMTVDNF